MMAFHGTDIHHPRQLACAVRGAVLGLVPYDLYLEASMWAHKVMSEHRPERLILTGFSMGGALAEMLAVQFTSPPFAGQLPCSVSVVGAVTFDAPSFPLQAFKDAIQLDGEHDRKAILQYKSAPNVINTLFPPVGAEVRRVAIPHCDDIHFESSDALLDASRLLLECAAVRPSLQEPVLALKSAATMAVTKALSVHAHGEAQWFYKQHSMSQMRRHLNTQYSVITWPRWTEVARTRLNTRHLSFETVVPVLGPAKLLMDKLFQGSWIQSMQSTRRGIEEHIRSIPGYSQHEDLIAREWWGVGLQHLEEGDDTAQIVSGMGAKDNPWTCGQPSAMELQTAMR